MLTTAWGPVGTRGGCGAGWGPGACPGGNAIQGTAWSKQVAPQPGQAPGPLIHSTPPLVPTGPWAASTSMDRIPRFGRQHSSGVRIISSMCISSITCRCKPHPSNSTGIPRNHALLIPQRQVMTTGDSTDVLAPSVTYTVNSKEIAEICRGLPGIDEKTFSIKCLK